MLKIILQLKPTKYSGNQCPDILHVGVSFCSVEENVMNRHPVIIERNSPVEEKLHDMFRDAIGMVPTMYRLEQDSFEVACKYDNEVEYHDPKTIGDWRVINDDDCQQVYVETVIDDIWYASHFYIVCYEEIIEDLLAAAVQ